MIDLNSLNEYGVPLHACNGYRHDEHYWCRVSDSTACGKGQPDLGIIRFADALRKTFAGKEHAVRDHHRAVRAAAIKLRKIHATTTTFEEWKKELNKFAKNYGLKKVYDAIP